MIKNTEGVAMEMPKYKCYKEVHALKIKILEKYADGSGLISPSNEGYVSFNVDREYMEKHKPEQGGYYVVYKDGYKSYSPAKAFEEGYTLIGKVTKSKGLSMEIKKRISRKVSIAEIEGMIDRGTELEILPNGKVLIG